MQAQLSVTITGANLNALIEGATKFINANSGTGNVKTEAATKAPAQATPKAASKKVAAPVVDEDETDLLSEDDESNNLGDLDDSTSDDGLNFDSEDEAEEIEEQPKAKKAPKVTEKDVNAAAMAHAKKHKKINTLALLQKKFKVKSIMELKPDQYAAAIAALKV